MPEITRDIIAAASAGDLAAFEVIYKACSALVYHVALKVTRHGQDADDVTQEVFLTLFHKLKQFRHESSFTTWVYRITVNHALNYTRKRTQERQRAVVFDDERHVDLPAPEVTHEESLANDPGLVNKLLDHLSPEYRVYIVLYEIRGLSYEEISETLNVNINTVRTRLRRAREKLLECRKRGEL